MRVFLRFWEIVTRLAGEGDYARYCDHLRARHPGKEVPTEKEFYLSRIREKYMRVSRCC
jgi:uncharacterized short protein YbdD (DUF466 family)